MQVYYAVQLQVNYVVEMQVYNASMLLSTFCSISCERCLFRFLQIDCPKLAGHSWGTTRGDSLVANRRQNKGLWCSAVKLTAECSTVDVPRRRTTFVFSP